MTPRRLVMGVVMGLLLLSLAQPGYTEYARHHMGTVLGLFFAPDRGSFALLRAVNYRFSVNPHVDLVIDGRGWWVPVWVDEALDVTFVGAGVRLNGDAGYVQGNMYAVKERIVEIGDSSEAKKDVGSGFGIGVNAGAEMRVNDLISIPIEFSLLYAKPANNVSGFGFASGINFNFGRVKPNEEL